MTVRSKKRASKAAAKASCHGKQKFPTREDAIGGIYALGRKTGAATSRMSAYRCTHCWIDVDGQQQRPWHFGHHR